MKKSILGEAKEFRTSKYYGVRIDIRKKNDITTYWYRADIMIEGKKYYLGAYLNEQFAAFAFNVAFNYVTNEMYIIENKVNLSKSDKDFIQNKVRILMLKKALIK